MTYAFFYCALRKKLETESKEILSLRGNSEMGKGAYVCTKIYTIKNKDLQVKDLQGFWCRRWDSNPHEIAPTRP